jgi:hypothetical protein
MNIQPIRNIDDYNRAVRRMDDIEYELAYEYRPELSIELDLLTDTTLEYDRKPKLRQVRFSLP